jgi:hypothetical protein
VGYDYRHVGHQWSDARNHHVGQVCLVCGLRMRWHKEDGRRGLVRQVKQGAEWRTVDRDPPCSVRSVFNRYG